MQAQSSAKYEGKQYMKHVPIVVLDFGSQYTQIIARKLRESGVYSEIVPYSESIEDIMARTPKGIILSVDQLLFMLKILIIQIAQYLNWDYQF